MIPDINGLTDDHMHSTAGSHDANASVADMCAQAVACGLRGVCFTEHLDFDERLPEYGYYRWDVVLREIDAARARFGDRLEIRLGLEVDFSPERQGEIEQTVARYPVDFVLGSVHNLADLSLLPRLRKSGPLPVEEISGLYRNYYQTLRLLIASGIADSLAHPDYPAKAGLVPPEAALPATDDEVNATLALAVQYGTGLEINTKRCPESVMTASPAWLRRFVALGGTRVTMGSDAHSVAQVGGGLHLARHALAAIGLTPTIFRGRVAG